MTNTNLFALVDKFHHICHLIMDESMVDFIEINIPIYYIKPVTSIGTTRLVGESGQTYNTYKVYHDDKISGEISYLGIEPINGEIDLEDFKRKLS